MCVKKSINILTQYADVAARVKYLRNSISKLEGKLARMTATDYGTVSDTVTRGKRGKRPLGIVKITGFRTEEYSRTQESLRTRKIFLKQQEEELLGLLSEAEEFIGRISDIEMRNILSLYYIEDMTWVQVAHAMNGLYKKNTYTENSCRCKYDRFLAKM